MAFPPYLIGLGVPLLVGLLGIGYFLFSQERHQQYSHQKNQNFRSSYENTDDVCPICLEDMGWSNSSKLNCGHKLHSACLVELNVRKQNKCPKCRADINY